MKEPEIRKRNEITLVGYGSRFISPMSADANNFRVIPSLWERFNSDARNLGDVTGEGYFGACISLGAEAANPHEFYYVAGAAAMPDIAVPDGMEKHTIPPATYAVFTHEGPVSNIGRTMQEIYGDWLPKSGRRRTDGPDLEFYDGRFTNEEGSVMEIWIPVAED